MRYEYETGLNTPTNIATRSANQVRATGTRHCSLGVCLYVHVCVQARGTWKSERIIVTPQAACIGGLGVL